jgi:hypothetical protein
VIDGYIFNNNRNHNGIKKVVGSEKQS